MRVAVVIALGLACSVARADEVGVIVTGDPGLASDVASHFERWLTQHGHTPVASPLPSDAIKAILDCVTADDSKCARGVVEKRSRSSSLVFAVVEIATRGSKDVTFTAYWFVKGHQAISERRVCESCTGDGWHGIADGMLSALAGSSQLALGKLDLRSKPSGLIVVLDNTQIGVTPLERDLPVGKHTIQLTHAGRTVGSRDVEITGGETVAISIKAKVELSGPAGSRLGPALLLAGGVVSLGVGAVFLYYGQKGGVNEPYVYPDSTPVGIAFGAVGLGATIVGGVLLEQASKPGPVASISPRGAYLGWLARF